MILQTPINHFNEDIQRSKDLKDYSIGLQPGMIRSDILRASWMMAVGAFDAYFCDAYGDLIARTLRAKKAQPGVQLPGKLNKILVPIPVVLDNNLNSGWLWRMIARDLIEKDNVLSIRKVKDLFNVFFRRDYKLFSDDGLTLERWIMMQQSRHRLFGFLRSEYSHASAADKKRLRRDAIIHIDDRMTFIFQRRHDCIHNCDRPKIAINVDQITPSYLKDVIEDIEYIVNRCHEDFKSEFPVFLTDLGFNPVTRNSVGV